MQCLQLHPSVHHLQSHHIPNAHHYHSLPHSGRHPSPGKTAAPAHEWLEVRLHPKGPSSHPLAKHMEYTQPFSSRLHICSAARLHVTEGGKTSRHLQLCNYYSQFILQHDHVPASFKATCMLSHSANIHSWITARSCISRASSSMHRSTSSCKQIQCLTASSDSHAGGSNISSSSPTSCQMLSLTSRRKMPSCGMM